MRGHGGPPPKSLDSDENFKPQHTLFCHKLRFVVIYALYKASFHPDSDENFKPEHTLFCLELRFVAIYALFGDLWAKKVPFWVKNSVSWARSALLHGIYIYCIKTTHLSRKL